MSDFNKPFFMGSYSQGAGAESTASPPNPTGLECNYQFQRYPRTWHTSHSHQAGYGDNSTSGYQNYGNYANNGQKDEFNGNQSYDSNNTKEYNAGSNTMNSSHSGYNNGFVQVVDINELKCVVPNSENKFNKNTLGKPRTHPYQKTVKSCPSKFVKQNMTNEDKRLMMIEYGLAKQLLDLLPDRLIEMFDFTICHLCNTKLNASSPASAHYTCRGHLKKIRQWFCDAYEKDKTMIPEGVLDLLLPKNTSIPLSILCELCGVRLTSKIQAETHIAGKMHRGIVERTKPPKYPNININDAEKRLHEQIKESCKNHALQQKSDTVVYQTTDTDKSENVQIINIQKSLLLPPSSSQLPLNPDLFCEICMISVSRADQLVSHKNGRKHLTKEKLLLEIIRESKAERG